LALRYSVLPVLKTKMRQTILHSITDTIAALADVMDMDKDKDKAEYPISRILTVRRPQCRESNNYKSLNASTERGGYSEMPLPF
jgi:hypothetical protein